MRFILTISDRILLMRGSMKISMSLLSMHGIIPNIR